MAKVKAHIDWMLIAWVCAAYVFIGIIPVVWTLYYSRWLLAVASIAGYILNLWLLSYAKKQDWG